MPSVSSTGTDARESTVLLDSASRKSGSFSEGVSRWAETGGAL